MGHVGNRGVEGEEREHRSTNVDVNAWIGVEG